MSDKKRLIKAAAVGLLCGLLAGIAILGIFAAVTLKTGLLPSAVINYITAAILGFGALAGGFVAAKLNGGAGLVVGAITGAALIVVLLLTSAIRGSADFSPMLFIKPAIALFGGALGGALGVR